MSFKEVSYKISSSNRADIRNEVVKLFLDEEAGTGKGKNTSRYSYVVESYSKYKIIIKRPGQLNKGFDFLVHIDGINFNKTIERKYKNGKISKFQKFYSNPSHADIIKALKQVKSNISIHEYETIKEYLKQIYNVKNPKWEDIEYLKYIDYNGDKHPVIVILLAIKWLFIEQDITYWNWSGRGMLRNSLEEEGLM